MSGNRQSNDRIDARSCRVAGRPRGRRRATLTLTLTTMGSRCRACGVLLLHRLPDIHSNPIVLFQPITTQQVVNRLTVRFYCSNVPPSCQSPFPFSVGHRHHSAAEGYHHHRTRAIATTATPIRGEVTITYQQGLPVVTVPLPSRKESCRFSLRPVTHTVGDFLQHVQTEDRGIDRISVKTTDEVRISASTSIESLMQQDFLLLVNDVCYYVSPPPRERLSLEQLQTLANVQALVSTLYEALNVEEHQLRRERDMIEQLEQLKNELEPLEKKKDELVSIANRRTNVLTWLGLGFMGVQFGILARLTWWEYSWDIVEPITYFVTYGTSMAAFAYYVLTRQDFEFTGVGHRLNVLQFHKLVKQEKFDVEKYNKIWEQIVCLENEVKRLQDPFFRPRSPFRRFTGTRKKAIEEAE